MSSLATAIRRRGWIVLSRARLFREFIRDARRYSRLSTPTARWELNRLTGGNLECQVTKDYHRIEKGLAFASPRRPFGEDARSRLQDAFGADPQLRAGNAAYVSYAADALVALDDWNARGVESETVTVLGSALPKSTLSAAEAEGFFASRRSVRNFDSKRPVDLAVVAKAVDLAGNAPSVCNRQGWRAHYFSDYADVQRLLTHQSGNRGFGESIPGLLIVTADVRMFSGTGERNQRWIDGSLFAMSVVWALHALGASTCMLNWSKDNADSARLREAADIPTDEDVIAMIAVGYPQPGFRVARSARRALDEVLIVHASETLGTAHAFASEIEAHA